MKSVWRPRRGAAICTVALLLATAAACSSSGDSKGSSGTTTTSAASSSARVTDLKLDPDKDYGNKYAEGILPVGDNKYVTDAATKGSVYLCRTPEGQAGGAGSRGPWFVNNNTTSTRSSRWRARSAGRAITPRRSAAGSA
jgi:hypothetical protein